MLVGQFFQLDCDSLETKMVSATFWWNYFSLEEQVLSFLIASRLHWAPSSPKLFLQTQSLVNFDWRKTVAFTRAASSPIWFSYRWRGVNIICGMASAIARAHSVPIPSSRRQSCVNFDNGKNFAITPIPSTPIELRSRLRVVFFYRDKHSAMICVSSAPIMQDVGLRDVNVDSIKEKSKCLKIIHTKIQKSKMEWYQSCTSQSIKIRHKYIIKYSVLWKMRWSNLAHFTIAAVTLIFSQVIWWSKISSVWM